MNLKNIARRLVGGKNPDGLLAPGLVDQPPVVGEVQPSGADVVPERETVLGFLVIEADKIEATPGEKAQDRAAILSLLGATGLFFS